MTAGLSSLNLLPKEDWHFEGVVVFGKVGSVGFAEDYCTLVAKFAYVFRQVKSYFCFEWHKVFGHPRRIWVIWVKHRICMAFPDYFSVPINYCDGETRFKKPSSARLAGKCDGRRDHFERFRAFKHDQIFFRIYVGLYVTRRSVFGWFLFDRFLFLWFYKTFCA